MNKLKIFFGSILAILALSLAFTSVANAHLFRSGTNVNIERGQKVDNTVFASGQTVDIGSEVTGDVYCVAQTVSISGKINGDVICAAQTINITGEVTGDLRLAGQTITIGAEVGGNAAIAAQTFNLESGAIIDRDASLAVSTATLNGEIGRDLALGAESVTIANQVGRDIQGDVANLRLTSSADIGRDITYTSNQDLQRSEGAEVGGEISRKDVVDKKSQDGGSLAGFAIGWFLYSLLALLLLAMVIAFIFPRAVHAVSEAAYPWPWKALLTGFIVTLLGPVALALIAATFIGIPLAFIFGLAWLIAVLLSGVFSGYYLGRLLLRNSRSSLMIMLIGILVLILLYFIPIIGFIFMLLALWIGTGMQVLALFRAAPKPNYALPAAASTTGVAKTTGASSSRSTRSSGGRTSTRGRGRNSRSR